jgi:hypothetical protein
MNQDSNHSNKVTVRCDCGKIYRLPVTKIGKKAKCPCGRILNISISEPESQESSKSTKPVKKSDKNPQTCGFCFTTIAPDEEVHIFKDTVCCSDCFKGFRHEPTTTSTSSVNVSNPETAEKLKRCEQVNLWLKRLKIPRVIALIVLVFVLVKQASLQATGSQPKEWTLLDLLQGVSAIFLIFNAIIYCYLKAWLKKTKESIRCEVATKKGEP